MHTTDEWTGCYPSNWKGVIVPEAMAHPAKYSSKLIRRIYEHLFQECWVKPGDRVIDPFGGVALGAKDAMLLGLEWFGNELELKFHRIGQGMDCPGINKKYWRRYHRRGQKWNSLNICPDCAKVLDNPGNPTSFFGEYQRIIPVRQAHRYNGNIEMWKTKCTTGDAVLFHGDSRHLLEVIGTQAQASVSSPPYADVMSQNNGGNRDEVIPSIGTGGAIQPRFYGSSDGQLGAMKAGQFDAAISSPPFLQSEGGTPEPKPGGTIDSALYARHAAGNKSADGYGQSEGQLSSMKDGGFDAAVSSPPYNPPMSQEHNGSRGGKRGTTPSEPGAFVKYGSTPGQLEGMGMEGFDAAISSPPYSAMQVEKNTKSIDRTKQYEAYKKSGGGQSFEGFCHTQEFHSQGYGNSDGQLSAMPAHSFDAAVTSPPWEDTLARDTVDADARRKWAREHGIGNAEHVSPIDMERVGERDQEYGKSEGQLGNDSGDDFWLAARTIVEQVYQALTPGGHACWVVKDYVKNKQIVPFGDQWRMLCEAVGFVTLHEHHAMLVHHKGTQHTLEGGTVERKTESKSFFRRLAEKNGSPRIDWETVYCMVKPEV